MIVKSFNKLIILCIAILLHAPFCYANSKLPNFFEASYHLYYNNIKIALVERHFFQNEDDDYIYRSTAKTIGVASLFRKDHIFEESRWNFINGRITPLRYIYQHTQGKKDRDVEINFDWELKKISNRVNERTWYMETRPGILDKLLYQLAIMASLQMGITPKHVTIADGGKIKDYTFKHLGDEVIKTPLGKLKTIKLARYKQNKQRLLIWCAYKLEFLPVQVIHIEKGKRTKAVIQSVTGLKTTDASTHQLLD